MLTTTLRSLGTFLNFGTREVSILKSIGDSYLCSLINDPNRIWNRSLKSPKRGLVAMSFANAGSSAHQYLRLNAVVNLSVSNQIVLINNIQLRCVYIGQYRAIESRGCLLIYFLLISLSYHLVKEAKPYHHDKSHEVHR